MGHRERLLAGARRCLFERGYARTTARDIVTASGTNLASIGYHFGSKEALLNAAMIEAIDEWGEELKRALITDTDVGSMDPIERFESIWTRVIESFEAHRPLWVATFEAFVQAQHSPELREQLAAGHEEARFGLAALFQGTDESMVDERVAQTVGSFYVALMSGLITQWLLDAQRAPSGGAMAEALRTIVASVQRTE
ncbi:MAG: TetR family transcriptional regulator [Rubrobacteraceae bacterium]|jgi:AcrR family transcriptional regulator|nr:TetR family transcriptional regulator [Rubrobacteraceae bacterium]